MPLVSVVVATYRHANYINDCLEGILMQKCDFGIEIIIGEDGSTDGTAEICMKRAEKHPDKMRLFIRDRGLSQMRDESDNSYYYCNAVWNRMAARGKYLAICEGDDYWTDANKLQKQADFLEANPEYSLVHTDASIYFEETRLLVQSNNKRLDRHPPSGSIFEDLLVSNSVQTCTILARKDFLDRAYHNLLPDLMKWPIGDYPLWLELSRSHKIKYLDEVTAVYRVHRGSASNRHDLIDRYRFLKSARDIRCFFINKYKVGGEAANRISQEYFRFTVRYAILLNDKKILNTEAIKNFCAKTIKDKLLMFPVNHEIAWKISRICKLLCSKIKAQRNARKATRVA